MVHERSDSLSSTFNRTMMEISSTEMALDLQGKRATRSMSGHESRLKQSRLMIVLESIKEDGNEAAEETNTRKDLVTNRRFSEPLHSAHAKAQLTSVRRSNVSLGTTLPPMKHHTAINLHKKDITAAKAFFPDFFPQQPLRDSYDCVHSQPTLEEIFSGQIKS